jgi:mRNA-degrading endonuclease RelE of RelBE toxin-antitoxin system
MRYEIVLSPEAIEDLKRLRARDRAEIKDALERHLRYQPTATSQSRLKKLRGAAKPQYRLRVGDLRVFYDVVESEVQILAIVAKSEAASWLENALQGR